MYTYKPKDRLPLEVNFMLRMIDNSEIYKCRERDRDDYDIKKAAKHLSEIIKSSQNKSDQKKK